MRKLKLVEWVAVVAALVVVSIFVFPSWFGSVFFPSNASPEAQNQATTAALNASTTSNVIPTTNMQNLSTVPGLHVYDNQVGTGAAVASGSQVTVNYTGKLSDGTVFDSNIDPQFGHVAPLPLTVGVGQVIKGWDLGLIGMKVGGTRTLVISPDLGYGATGQGPIPPNATLTFTVQLLSVK